MTRITNTEHILLLLRAHLQRSQKARRKSVDQKTQLSASQRDPLVRIQELVRHGSLPQEDVQRAVIQGLLLNEIGDKLSNEAKFQTLIDDVFGLIRRDQAMVELLNRAIRELTAD